MMFLFSREVSLRNKFSCQNDQHLSRSESPREGWARTGRQNRNSLGHKPRDDLLPYCHSDAERSGGGGMCFVY